MNWQKVCRPLGLGGLGIPNLEILGWSLSLRWLWRMKTQQDCSWAGFHVHPMAAALFAVSVQSVVGNGAETQFWNDCWVYVRRIADLAPNLIASVSRRTKKITDSGRGSD